ncbi:hypothetical protein OIU78_025498 [Salix suchowensis]|nr:hypothetical protein OIU78_025498 [Salix suchowensis]
MFFYRFVLFLSLLFTARSLNQDGLSMLVLEDNELSGGLPDGIQGWKSLNELNLTNNKLSGQIPDEIGSLQALNYLDLSGNYFSGKIPIELEDLNLNQLNLSNNMLSGALPPLYAKEMYRSSFLGNPGLCGDLKDLCPQEGDSRKQSYLWILRSTFILAAIVFVVGVAWFYFKYQNFKKEKEVITISKWRSFHKIGFSEFEIPDCLKEDNVIGSGASGKVYKAVLSNGETVAVKKVSGESRKDNTNHSSEKDEFEAEVETLGRIRHKNIAPAAILHQVFHLCPYELLIRKYAYTLNEKSDIYSFGVVILELVTGRLPVDPEFGEKDLVKWVCATLDQNGMDHVVDPKLDSRYRDEISKILEIGLRCTTASPVGRPSMRRVVKMLQEAGGMGHKPEADKNDECEIPDCLKEDNVIGSGASGKAVLSNGETVAVKKQSGESREDNTNTLNLTSKTTRHPKKSSASKRP